MPRAVAHQPRRRRSIYMSFSRAHVGAALAAGIIGCGPSPQTQNPPEVHAIHLPNVDDARIQGDLSHAAVAYAKQRIDLAGADDDWNVRLAEKGMDGNMHVRMAQTHAGVKVYGGDIVVHANGDKFQALHGNIVANLDGFDVSPNIPMVNAIASSKADYASRVKDSYLPLSYSRESTELVILPADSGRQATLAWHVTFFTELQA